MSSRMSMQDAVEQLLENLLNGPVEPNADAWNRFGEHAEHGIRCPLFKTDKMCQACCEHFTRDLFDGARIESAFDDAYTRFRLTARREVSRPVFRHLASYACRRCPNNPLRQVPAKEADSD
jgi:hypothetical protein